ncbi:hypothetical protein [Selenomonas ruminantium]|uniref:hypothetical protein n=1 Tax=Selenomonas ruminantium TaxID=971 RepID=UPI0012FEE96E|nr:hypothetical protein [Selenomonas ruminantium]
MYVTSGDVVMASNKYIDVLVTGAKSSWQWAKSQLWLNKLLSHQSYVCIICGDVVMISNKYIDVFVTGATSPWQWANP